ncbi:DUF72 domain-containing protein [Xylophilus rhododendri]|uniref:DUF72 domain-containing protein n=1 Tax=Xylophilus rhododendri TaxID=2697032 RepID=A0A857J0C2_9BURK|nr:DUF72 domain-containing protein [Xylophilus rhododendri]QHI97314.1 DUF72 domain-containing protein [Xylophilus rhododendri]
MASTTHAAEPPPALRIGTAGWSLPRQSWPAFPAEGTHLQRYAGVFGMAEIDTSFYRPHQPKTYARWGESTPDHFRFSVKLPREITHDRALADVEQPLAAFLGQVEALGPRLGCLLVQLAPSLAFEAATVDAFLNLLRRQYPGLVALEPRHASWFGREAHALLAAHRVGRVLADPVREAGGESPGGWRGLAYLRLHGSPRTYYSGYSVDGLADWARLLRRYRDEGAECWCVFDNTAAGHAVPDALALQALLSKS